MKHFFFPNSSGDLRSDAHQSQIIGGMQMWTILKLLGDIFPLGFGTPGSKPFESTRILTFESQLKKLNCLILVFLAI